MGVEHYHCKVCEESIYEEFVGRCQTCQSSLCTYCLVNKDVLNEGEPSKYAYQYGVRFDSTNEKLVTELVNDGYITKDENGEYDIEEGELIDDSAIAPKYCPFCQGNEINKDEVLDYLLRKFGLGLNQVWEIVKQDKKFRQ